MIFACENKKNDETNASIIRTVDDLMRKSI